MGVVGKVAGVGVHEGCFMAVGGSRGRIDGLR
jgi:hypothetical protein